MRSLILSQCIDLDVIWENLGTYKTVRKTVGSDLFDSSEVQRFTVVKYEVDHECSDCTGCFRINLRTDVTEITEWVQQDVESGGFHSKLKPICSTNHFLHSLSGSSCLHEFCFRTRHTGHWRFDDLPKFTFTRLFSWQSFYPCKMDTNILKVIHIFLQKKASIVVICRPTLGK